MYLSGLTMAARQKASKLSVSDHNVVAGSSLVPRWFFAGHKANDRNMEVNFSWLEFRYNVSTIGNVARHNIYHGRRCTVFNIR